MILSKIKLSGLVVLATAVLLTASVSESFAQRRKTVLVTDQAALAKLIAAVEANPDSLSAHEAYIKAAGINTPSVIAQYEKWMQKYPKNAMFPYAVGKAYEGMESPKAKPYLLKAVKIDPKFAEAWSSLSSDADRWGDFEGGIAYLKKAKEANPKSPDYAFYYAYTFHDKDIKKYREMSLDIAKRFPTNERGAQALYWLAAYSSDNQYKIKIYELLKKSFSPAKFDWSSGGMSDYYTLLLDVNAEKAVTLAQEMVNLKGEDNKDWQNKVIVAKNIVEVKKLIKAKKGTEALAVIAKMKLPRYFGFGINLSLLKGEAMAISGNVNAAYDSLIVYFAKTPDVKLKDGIANYGSKLDKGTAQIEADIWKRLDVVAKQATPFTLKNYLTPGSTSLADYQGKVVLLTYWFPGCGPCRGEFPHFENVIRKFKGKAVDYVGINIASNQNDYVIPFMKGSGYSFTPLEDVEGRVKGNLDNRGAAPMNFLIDQQGRIIFSNFRIEEANKDQLELMINMVLAHKV